MPVRVKVKLKSKTSEVVTTGLLNTGFTSLELDILIPKGLAERMNFWPPPEGAILETLDTAGGEVLSYIIPESIELTVLAKNKASKNVRCNVIVSTHEKEVLLSDALIEELNIEIISPKTGIRRFKGGAEEESVKPEYCKFDIFTSK
ncbi:MAG: hypothetical protein QW589_02065 [Candidatus Bathyarchaeia archaeon]